MEAVVVEAMVVVVVEVATAVALVAGVCNRPHQQEHHGVEDGLGQILRIEEFDSV